MKGRRKSSTMCERYDANVHYVNEFVVVRKKSGGENDDDDDGDGMTSSSGPMYTCEECGIQSDMQEDIVSLSHRHQQHCTRHVELHDGNVIKEIRDALAQQDRLEKEQQMRQDDDVEESDKEKEDGNEMEAVSPEIVHQMYSRTSSAKTFKRSSPPTQSSRSARSARLVRSARSARLSKKKSSIKRAKVNLEDVETFSAIFSEGKIGLKLNKTARGIGECFENFVASTPL